MNARVLALLLVAAGCAAAPRAQTAPSQPIALRNPGFEAAPRAGERCPAEWGCTMHADPDSFRFFLDSENPAEGSRSLCVQRVTHEPWAVLSQSVPAQAWRGRKLRLSLALRGENLDGAGAGPWVLVNGAAGMLLSEERPEKLGSAWRRRAIEFVVPPQASAIELGATLLGGGRVCIDDVRLEAL